MFEQNQQTILRHEEMERDMKKIIKEAQLFLIRVDGLL